MKDDMIDNASTVSINNNKPQQHQSLATTQKENRKTHQEAENVELSPSTNRPTAQHFYIRCQPVSTLTTCCKGRTRRKKNKSKKVQDSSSLSSPTSELGRQSTTCFSRNRKPRIEFDTVQAAEELAEYYTSLYASLRTPYRCESCLKWQVTCTETVHKPSPPPRASKCSVAVLPRRSMRKRRIGYSDVGRIKEYGRDVPLAEYGSFDDARKAYHGLGLVVHPFRCPTCDLIHLEPNCKARCQRNDGNMKEAFATQRDAEKSAVSKCKAFGHAFLNRPYQCEAGCWHLTSQLEHKKERRRSSNKSRSSPR
jgi:hypothetical protein